MEIKTRPKLFYGYIMVIACFCFMVALWGVYYCFGVFFSSFIQEFGWSRATISGAYSIMGLMFGLFSILVARLSIRFGPRKTLGACGLITGLGYILLSQIHSIWQLYVFCDVLIAFGMGAYISLLPLVAKWFTLRRSLMTGVVFSGMGLGGVIFPPVANWLISIYQWRTSYIILGVVVAAVTLAASQFLKDDPRKYGLLPFGVNQAENKNFKVSGLTYQEAIRNRQFWIICMPYFTYLFCLVSVTVHIVIHAIDTGISPAAAAGIMSVFGISQVVGMNATGYTADKYSNKTAFMINFILMAIAFAWVLFIAKDVLTFYIFAVILGFAAGGAQILFSPVIAEVFGLKSHGMLLGTASFVASFGAALGSFSAGYIFDVSRSYSLAFIICAVLSIAAEVVVLFIRPIVHKRGALTS